MKAKDLANKKSEILEPLYVVADELVEREKAGKLHSIEYTDMDVIAASVTFVQILANRKAHYYFREASKSSEPSDLENVTKEMEEYGVRIRQIVKEMTNVDLGKS